MPRMSGGGSVSGSTARREMSREQVCSQISWAVALAQLLWCLEG